MRAGALKRIIDLEYPSRVADGAGGFTTTWTKDSTVNADIQPTTAKEQVWGMQTAAVITHVISIRFRSNIRSDWRIKYGSTYFNIVSLINVDMRSIELQIVAKQVES